MLNIVNYNKDEYDFPALIVLGCFDAIHIGHQELLKKAKLQAKINGLDLGVMMFAEGKGGRQVFTFEERLAMLAPYNVKFAYRIDYTEDFKKTTAQQFLSNIEEHINIKGYMSGKDFRFGAGAKGKSSTLKNFAEDEDNGVWYMSVKDVTADGEKVSTTLIKQYIEEGKIQKAEQLLGRKYFVTGKVCEGHGRGAKLVGFPTANIMYPENKVLVAPGVYGVEAEIDGTVYKGVANCGARPTFGEDAYVMEAYFEGLSEDLYGKEITVKFLNYIRGIKKFENAEELSEQIAHDVTCIGAPDNAFEETSEEAAQAPAEQLTPAAAEAESNVAEAEKEVAVSEAAEEAPAKNEEQVEVAEKAVEKAEEQSEGAPVNMEIISEDIETPAEELSVAAEELSLEQSEPAAPAAEAKEQPEPATAAAAEEKAETATEAPAEEKSEESDVEPADSAAEEEVAADVIEETINKDTAEEQTAEVVADEEETPAEQLSVAAEEITEKEEAFETPAEEKAEDKAEEKAEPAATTEPAADAEEKAEEEQAEENAEEVAEEAAAAAAEEMNAAAELSEDAADGSLASAEDELSLEELGELSAAADGAKQLAEEVFAEDSAPADEAAAESVEEEVAAEEAEEDEEEDEKKPHRNKRRRKGRGKSERRRGETRKK